MICKVNQILTPMQIKEVKPLALFCHSVRTTLSGLTPRVRVAAGKLYRQAAGNRELSVNVEFTAAEFETDIQ